ncbi:hypothetical protein [Streptomyces capitiformicae]|uniref:Uncharacterized protein n=1 Tax=Streptomyces capitiformicae TaxID=2014920 RepID=A0A918Z2E5_9ACTN|nr:hypothetical protein [Streptomyces capitiformicae]GHE34215.1 hypothetical protein GCM10017771_51660 [Streptomyces capitiformicae]
MATSVIPNPHPALTLMQAVALGLLRDGFKQRTITARTGIQADTLYALAVLHDITAPCGTVEGHDCHEAREEEPCAPCTHAHGRAHARQHAQRRRTLGAVPRSLRPRGREGRRAVR